MQALLVPLFFARKKAGKGNCRIEADLAAAQEQRRYILIDGMACMVLAIKTPSFLREFLVPAGGSGSGVINNVYHSVRLVGMVKGMAK